jgi:hypothetical protein
MFPPASPISIPYHYHHPFFNYFTTVSPLFLPLFVVRNTMSSLKANVSGFMDQQQWEENQILSSSVKIMA